MARTNTPTWDSEAAFDEFVHGSKDDGTPLGIMDIAREYLPEGRTVDRFKQRVYKHARTADWKRRRADIWAKEGRVPNPLGGAKPKEPEPEPDKTTTWSDGFKCPKCGASLVMDDDALAKDNAMINKLRDMINTLTESIRRAGGQAQPPMLNSLTGSLEKLLKMQDKQQRAVQAAIAEKNIGSMSEMECAELERLIPVILELIARSPRETRVRISKQLEHLKPLPPADEPKVVDIRPERGA